MGVMKKVLALALAVPLFAACGGTAASSSSTAGEGADSAGESSAPSSESANPESSASSSAVASTQGLKIGFPIPGPAPYIDGYFKKWDELAVAAGIDTIKTTGDWTPALQAEQIDSLIAQQPDVIVVWAVDNKAIIPVLARIEAAGIKAVASNAYPEDQAFDYLAGYTGPDDVLQGKIAGQSLVEAIGATGDVGMVRGTAGTAAHDNRATGFEEALAAAPGVKLVADQSGAWGDSKKAYDIVSAMLKQNPSIVGVFVQDDGMAEGAAKAAKDANVDIKIVGIGGSCSGFDQIRAGNLSATTVQDPYSDAESAFDAAVKVASGETIEKVTYLDPPVVTSENVDTFTCHW